MSSSRLAAPHRATAPPTAAENAAEGISGQPYPIRIPDGEYLAFCTGSYWDRKSRRFGERIYLDFRVFDGEYAGKKLQMFLKPSSSYSSKFYRSWSIAHDGPPRSRNTKMSPKIFIDKLFRVRTSTVRPRHQITGPDGRQRPGEPQPEHLWYSKVDCLLSLEVTNEVTNSPVVAFQPKPNSATPVVVTEISPNHFSHREMDGGGYGRRTLDSGYWVRQAGFARWGGQSDNAPQPVGGEERLTADPTPTHSTIQDGAPSSGRRRSESASDACTRAQLEPAIFRRRLFELYDNLPPNFDHARRLEEMAYKAVRDLFLDRSRELKGISEEAVLADAQKRLRSFAHFAFISDYEKRRNQAVACVVNAAVDAALAARERMNASERAR